MNASFPIEIRKSRELRAQRNILVLLSYKFWQLVYFFQLLFNLQIKRFSLSKDFLLGFFKVKRNNIIIVPIS